MTTTTTSRSPSLGPLARGAAATTAALLLLTACAGASDTDEADAALEEARALASEAAADREAAESAAAAASEAAAAAAATPSPEPDDEPAPSEPPEPSAAPAEADADGQARLEFVMPDLRGLDLQSAQDTIQEIGVFFTTSSDLRGSRLQVLDSNWVVCTSQPAPGTTVTGAEGDLEGTIDFGVVKRDETCP